MIDERSTIESTDGTPNEEHDNLNPDVPQVDATADQSPESSDAPESATAEASGLEIMEDPPSFDELELNSQADVEISSELTAEIESLQGKLQALQSQFDQRNEQYVRIAADFENFRKRAEREKEELTLQARSSTILELLPVLDTFTRAKEQLNPESEEAQKVHNSYQGVFKQLLECLKRVGVAPMECEGKEFDPTFHNAIMREPTDQHPEGTIIQEFQSGFMLGDRVLRHAVVKVASALEENGTAEDQEVSAES